GIVPVTRQRSDRMRRREFIVALGGAATWPLAGRAQQPAMPVVGYINSGAPGPMAPLVSAFHEGLSQAGYVEGRNVAGEYPRSEGHWDRLPELAADLVRGAGGGDRRNRWQRACAGRQGRNHHDSDRLRERRRCDRGWSRQQPRATRRQRDGHQLARVLARSEAARVVA